MPTYFLTLREAAALHFVPVAAGMLDPDEPEFGARLITVSLHGAAIATVGGWIRATLRVDAPPVIQYERTARGECDKLLAGAPRVLADEDSNSVEILPPEDCPIALPCDKLDMWLTNSDGSRCEPHDFRAAVEHLKARLAFAYEQPGDLLIPGDGEAAGWIAGTDPSYVLGSDGFLPADHEHAGRYLFAVWLVRLLGSFAYVVADRNGRTARLHWTKSDATADIAARLRFHSCHAHDFSYSKLYQMLPRE